MTEWRVYFASCCLPNGVDTGLVKVGVSGDLDMRIPALGAQTPLDHTLIGSVPGELFSESLAHLVLKPFLARGEYFWLTPECRSAIDSMIKRGRVHGLISDRGLFNLDTRRMSVNAGLKRLRVASGEVAARHGRAAQAVKRIQAGQKVFSRPLMATAALIAAERGRAVSWPEDFFNHRRPNRQNTAAA